MLVSLSFNFLSKSFFCASICLAVDFLSSWILFSVSWVRTSNYLYLSSMFVSYSPSLDNSLESVSRIASLLYKIRSAWFTVSPFSSLILVMFSSLSTFSYLRFYLETFLIFICSAILSLTCLLSSRLPKSRFYDFRLSWPALPAIITSYNRVSFYREKGFK
jgi:hypothetical protein